MKEKTRSWIENVSEKFQIQQENYINNGGSLADSNIIEQLKGQNQSREVLQHELKKKNMPFLAILPKDFFGNLVKNAESLYTLRTITSDCRVKVNSFAMQYYFLQVTTKIHICWLIFLLLFVPASQLIILVAGESPITVILLGLGFAKIFLMMMLINKTFNTDSFLERALLYLYIAFSIDAIVFLCLKFGKKRVTDVLFGKLYPSIIWPKKTDENSQTSEQSIKVNFSLFTDSICKDLQSVGEHYAPYIVADESSICISKEEKNLFLSSMNDPMVCADIGDHTVIFSQYGEFPAEQKMIEYVKTYFNSLGDKKAFSKN